MKHQKVIHGGDIYQTARRIGKSPEEILDFSGNINPLGIPEGLKEHIYDQLDQISHYPDMDYRDLKTALASYANCLPEQVMVGNGGTELISLIFRALHPKKVLIPSPTFSEYERGLNLMNIETASYRLKEEMDFALDYDGLTEELKDGYDMLILCNPNNPTGKCIDKELLRRILDYTREYHILTMVDETFIEFVDDVDASSIVDDLAQYKNLIVLRGFSKFFAAPGLRLGYVLADSGLLQLMLRYKEPWTVNSIADIAGTFLVTDIDNYQRGRSWIVSERSFLYEKLCAFPQFKVYVSHANFFLIKLKEPALTAAYVKDLLEEKGILIRDVSSFYYLDQSFMRIAIHTREKNLILLTALEEILAQGVGLCQE